MAKCAYARDDGTVCEAYATPDGFCQAHSPALAVERQTWRVAGGRATITGKAEKPASLRSVEDVLQGIEWLAADVVAQRNSGERARALTAILRLALDVVKENVTEARLAEIERKLAELAGARRG